MMQVRHAAERGQTRLDWLDSRHSFSFANYYDPSFMGFGPLRVINDDRVQPSRGFGTHGHQDMEIISYVLEGAMAHKDSAGNGSVIRPGDVQRMSAGTGVHHSEYNVSDTDPLHFMQVWILPEKKGSEPEYEQKTFSVEDKQGGLRLIGSRDGRDGSITIHQDVDLYATVLGEAENVRFELGENRKGWVQLARGDIEINGRSLSAGDGVAIDGGEKMEIAGRGRDAEFLLFDMTA